IAVGFPGAAFTCLRKKAVDDIVSQDTQLFRLARPVLKTAEAHETWGNPGDNGRSLDSFAINRVIRHDDGQGSRSWNSQTCHGFAGQILPNGRTQHGAAIAHAGIRCSPGPFKLKFLWPLRGDDFPKKMGAPVSQLAGPNTELMTAVNGRERTTSRQRLLSRYDLQELGRFQNRRVDAQYGGNFNIGMQELWVTKGLRLQKGVKTPRQTRIGIFHPQISERGHE